MAAKLTKTQKKAVEELKSGSSFGQDWKCDKDFCVLCPESCATDPHHGAEHWHCPMLDGQICNVCCYYDMDLDIRGRWPKICKNLNCNHYNEEETIAGMRKEK